MTDGRSAARASRHRSRGRFDPPRWLARLLAGGAPLLSLVPALVLGGVVQATGPAAHLMPQGAARFDLAAAWLLSAPGGTGGGSWLADSSLGRVQLGLLIRLLHALGGQSVLAAAASAMLVLALLQIGLVWLLVRTTGGSALAAGLATAVVAIAPVAVGAHAQVSPAGVGAVWALAAAVLALAPPSRLRLAAAGAVAVGAVAATPLTLLPLIAVAVVVAARVRAARPAVRLAAPAGLLGGVLAVLLIGTALGPGSAAAAAVVAAGPSGPAGGVAGLSAWAGSDPVSLVAAVVAVGALIAGRGSLPVVGAAIAVALASFWPAGRDPVTPLVVLLPLVALSVAAVVDRAVLALADPRFVRSVIGAAWLTGVVAVVLTATIVWIAGLGSASSARPVALAGQWLRTSVPAGEVVLVDLPMWPDLAAVRSDVGWYATTTGHGTTPSSLPWTAADYVVADDGLGRGTGDARSVLARAVPVARFGSGGSRLSVLAVAAPQSTVSPPSVTAADRAAQRYRRQIGAQLAENARVTLSSEARAQLLAGQVDARIALVVAQFATEHRVTIGAFDVTSGDDTGIRTSVLISAVDGRRIPADGERTGELLRFLTALRGDYTAESIDAGDDGMTATFASDPDLVPGP